MPGIEPGSKNVLNKLLPLYSVLNFRPEELKTNKKLNRLIPKFSSSMAGIKEAYLAKGDTLFLLAGVKEKSDFP